MRAELCEKLVEGLQGCPEVDAVWEGGSAATGRLDEYSDLDLVVAARDREVVFSTVRSMLDGFGVSHEWRLAEPVWHGHSQCLWAFEGAPPGFFLDLVVMDSRSENRFLEVERHGQPVAHFDRAGLLEPQTADTPSFLQQRQARLDQIEKGLPFFEILVRKQCLRRDWVAGWGFYRQLLSFLVELWGMEYRPWRYDFGFRTTSEDFPAPLSQRLESYCFLASPDQLLPRAESVLEDCRQSLQRLRCQEVAPNT